jgi:hypothetical protein
MNNMIIAIRNHGGSSSIKEQSTLFDKNLAFNKVAEVGMGFWRRKS